jgi:hypothetical protein
MEVTEWPRSTTTGNVDFTMPHYRSGDPGHGCVIPQAYMNLLESTMPFEFNHAPIPVNSARAFTFESTVQQFVLGISGFRLGFTGKDAHYVKKLRISLSSRKLGNSNIEVTAAATLDSKGGTHVDPASSVDVSILAWVGASDHDSLTLANMSRISNVGINGNTTQIAPERPVFRQAVLAGFDFSYSDDDHELQQVSIAVGSNINDSTVTPIVTAAMIGTASRAATCLGDCGLIALCTPGTGLRATSYYLDQGKTSSFASAAPGTKYVAFLTSFNLRYLSGEHHKIKTILARISVDANGTATAEVDMTDKSNKAETAWVTGVTFGYPQPPKPPTP